MKRATYVLAAVLSCLAAPVAAQSITVVSPNGGESWAIGTAQTITWTAGGITDGFNIVLLRGGVRIGRLVYGLPASTTSYRWTSAGRLEDGTVVPVGTDYSISVRSMGGGSADVSNGVFALGPTLVAVAPTVRVASRPTSVRVTQPNDRRLIRIGTETDIRWASENARPEQRIRVWLVRYAAGCRAGGSEVTSLGGVTLATGRMVWHALPPLRPCDNCTIRLTPQVPGDFPDDESDDCFVLRGATTVRLIAPNGAERLRRDMPVNVSWEVVGPQSGQRLYVSLTSGAPSCGTTRRRVAELPIEARSFTWPGDATLAAGQYGFHIAVVTGPRTGVTLEAQDQSDGCFTLF